MAVSSCALRTPVLPRLRALGRADLAVIGVAALGAGNVWARVGAGNADTPPDPARFFLGAGLVALAAVLCVVAASRRGALPTPWVLSLALLLQAVAAPDFALPPAGVVAIAVLLAAIPLVRPRAGWLLLGLTAATEAVALTHAWTWGAVANDVFTEVQGASAALLHGQNPYAAQYTVYLGNQGHTQLFGSAAFCYGPVVILLSIPGRLLGDVRVMALAMNLAILAAALVWTHRNLGGGAALRNLAALWVSSPLIPFMVLMDWTDSFCVAGFAWWLVLRDRHRWWATLALTMALGSKPSVLLLMVPMLAWSGAMRRELVWAALGALALLLPFAIWTGVPQFVQDTVLVFADLPARHDALTLDGAASVVGVGLLPPLLLWAGVVVATTFFALRRNRDVGALLANGSALVIIVCLFGKQAFLNYYFIAAMAMLLLAGSGDAVQSLALRSPLRSLSQLGRSVRSSLAGGRQRQSVRVR
ncbi:MAG: hypothetical protein ACYDAC_03415 [Candidatus Dormibacteria bacterium]